MTTYAVSVTFEIRSNMRPQAVAVEVEAASDVAADTQLSISVPQKLKASPEIKERISSRGR